jgi:biotin operon repressor
MSTPSLAEELRQRSDDELRILFTLRPDLISPVPADISSLAARAASSPSLLRAIETLNFWQYQVLISCARLNEPFTKKDVLSATNNDAAPIIDSLISLALIYRDGKKLRLPRILRDVVGDNEKLVATLAPQPPAIQGNAVKQSDVDRAAIASISDLLRWIEELLNFWSEETPIAIQSGGLGVRDLKKASEHLGVAENCAAFVAELAYVSGLVIADRNYRILPTVNFDAWLDKPQEDRWCEIVRWWLATSRVAGLIGRSESRNISALGAELDRATAGKIRKIAIETLNEATGLQPSIASVQRQVKWRYPHHRGMSISDDLVLWTLRECEWLGITGSGAMSTYGSSFMRGESRLGINEALPQPVDHILIQGDGTAIAPGPLLTDIARQLSTFADIESRGAGTVYRFSDSSIRRGLDHGHSGEEILLFLKKISKTSLPQPLEYLISDVAKKHGRLRVGVALSYLRCDDKEIMESMLADSSLENLSLRSIASNLLLSGVEIEETIETLRSAGYFPVAEGKEGVALASPSQPRAKARPRPPRVTSEAQAPNPELLEAALRVLRTGDKVAEIPTSHELPRTTSNETLALLHESINNGFAIEIGYADNDGEVTIRTVDPISISHGSLIARDHTTKGISPFKIARITGVTTI